ncbi:hypothetical protein, partial [Actinomadura roseirufa]|uniref:hypothetical protein n=1 Tax=Actinomadura roseirufa TaxID=2094049 RepID=UPI001A955D90
MTTVPEALLAPLTPPPAPAPQDDIVPGLVAPSDRLLCWEPGEKAEWEATGPAAPCTPEALEDALSAYAAGFRDDRRLAVLFAGAPEDAVRPHLAGWRPEGWDMAEPLKPVVARFGLDARDAALHAATARRDAAAILLPFLDAEVALLMARWAHRAPTTRDLTEAWFGRHGTAAVPLLTPAALGGKPGRRRDAVHALRLIAVSRGPGPVAEAAAPYG